MKAKIKKGEFHWCEGCSSILDGQLKEIKGWKDQEGDWIDDAHNYGDFEEFLETQDLVEDDVTEAFYTECSNGCDSDDGWEMEALAFVHVCGSCGARYQSIEVAGDCCMPYSCNICGTRHERHHEAMSCIVSCTAKLQELKNASKEN